ncbi:MAG: GGDEF domain-containing protein [Thermodesulfobacteriota bacterium]
MFDRLPFLSPPLKDHRRARALQGMVLAVFAPAGWFALKVAAGAPPLEIITDNCGLFAYMLFGTMSAFGLFGWLLGREEERLSRLAMLDELTGLANNRLFGQRLDECIAASRRSGRPLSLLLIDMDHFKAINDTHGHQAGDMALKMAAAVIRSSVRGADVAARVGGEEFAVILPDTGADEAAKAAERILAGMRQARVLLANSASFGLSASIGLSGGVPGDGESSFALFAEADKALYKAKDSGRDRMVRA